MASLAHDKPGSNAAASSRDLTSARPSLQRLTTPPIPDLATLNPLSGHRANFMNVPVEPTGGSSETAAAALRHAMQGSSGEYPHRGTIEAATGRSFAAVRSYGGPNAVEACAAVGARAFTVQNVSVFAEPAPPLHVAHEAVHVVQQRGDESPMNQPPSTLEMARPGDATEREADTVSSTALEHGEISAPTVHGQSRLNGFFWLSGCDSKGCSRDQGPKDKKDAGAPPPVSTIVGVKEADKNGWLNVMLGGTKTPLPWYLKMTGVTRAATGRDSFTIDESLKKGQKGDVAAKSPTESYLGPITQGPAASVTFEKAAEKLTYGSKSGVSAYTDADNPIPTGAHDIQIPDEPHHLADGYLGDSPYATTWFRLGTSGDRYLHPGRHSLGCTTVRDTKTWTDIYTYLINSRKSDTAVGTLTVKP